MTLNYNEPITFGRGGSAVGLSCSGIDFTEDVGQSWTTSPLAEMDIQLPFARKDVEVEIEAFPFLVPGQVRAQNMFLYLGGLFVGYQKFINHAVATFPIARGVLSGRTVRLSMVIPTAVSPDELGISGDLRELGIYLTTIVFKTI